MTKRTLIGPFKQIIPMTGLALKGAISDHELEVLAESGIVIENKVILATGNFDDLKSEYPQAEIQLLKGNHVCLPGFVDAHTHICFGGSRAKDDAMGNAGKTYLEIANAGGGIWDTVIETRKASIEELTKNTIKRANRHLKNGTTTLEVKSGYGLTVDEELKMLRAIKKANEKAMPELISTCLAAHMLPKDFDGSEKEYLKMISKELFPIL